MFTDENFRFLTNVSVESYKTKEEAIACLSAEGAKAVGKHKMAFRERSLTPTEFLEAATSGHAFCSLFDFDVNKQYWLGKDGEKYRAYPTYHRGPSKGAMKIGFKSDRFFRGSQTVFVDIDLTHFVDVREYLQQLYLPPTAVYMSYSDNKDKGGVKSRRFRLVYVFNRPMDKEELNHVAFAIHDRIVFDTKEKMEDFCGTRVSQYMNGVYGNNETYISNYIYDYSDFPEDQSAVATTQEEAEVANNRITFDPDLLNDMANLSYERFMHYYSLKYRYVYRVEKEWGLYPYQKTDETYLQLFWYREKVKDGQHRRRKLLKNACLRRLMFPDIDPNTLLFNLYVDLWRFFDNSDHTIKLDTLKRKVRDAFAKSREELVAYCDWEIQYWQKNRPQFILKTGSASDRGALSKISKGIRQCEFLETYNPQLSVSENIANGLDLSVRTVYRYCKDLHIMTQPFGKETEADRRNAKRSSKLHKIELFKAHYCPQQSLRENQDNLSSVGLKIGVETIRRWANKYIIEENTLQTVVADSFAPFGFPTEAPLVYVQSSFSEWPEELVPNGGSLPDSDVAENTDIDYTPLDLRVPIHNWDLDFSTYMVD